MEKNAKELREVANSYKNRIGEVEARIRGASTQPHGGRGSKEPGSSFRGYELTVCAALDEAEKEADHDDVELD